MSHVACFHHLAMICDTHGQGTLWVTYQVILGAPNF